MLGVRFDAESLRTADIDIAESAGISAAVAQKGSLDLLERLKSVEPRPVSDQTKARKDIAQARQVMEVLVVDRPNDIDEAVTAMQSRPKLCSHVRAELDRITSASEGMRSQE